MSFHYEPISNVDEEYIKNCSSLELLQGMHHSYRTTYNNHIFTQKDIHMSRQFFVKRVCKYGLSAIGALTMVKQVEKVSGNNENLWVSDLVEPELFIKLMDIDRDWVIENMYNEMLNYNRIIFFSI